LFVVGVVRGGTTSLADCLAQHPEIFMSPVKEPHFFTASEPPLTPVIKDEREYLDLFAGASEHLRGEASASYFADPTAAPAIKRVSPDAKILVILRDPIERAASHYWHAVQYGREKRTFGDAVADELAGRPRPGSPLYVRRGMYSGSLRQYLEIFGENVHVVFLEELTLRPQEQLMEVFRFLGVEEDVAERITLLRLNAFRLPRPTTGRLVGSEVGRRIGRRLVPRRYRSHIEALLFRAPERPPIDPTLRRVLNDAYEGDREPLERLLGRNVPWAFDLQPENPIVTRGDRQDTGDAD